MVIQILDLVYEPYLYDIIKKLSRQYETDYETPENTHYMSLYYYRTWQFYYETSQV